MIIHPLLMANMHIEIQHIFIWYSQVFILLHHINDVSFDLVNLSTF